MKCIFSVDVEDWFHILDVPSTPCPGDWDQLPSRVEKNFRHLLDIFSETNVQTTCFFLGWVAQRFPHLVREAAARGHEIASHGFYHQLVHAADSSQFYSDILRARQLLEDVSGRPVLGYRAPGFSVKSCSPWFFDQVAEAGYQYDSSVFPATCEHGGLSNALHDPHHVHTRSGDIVEFPVTVARLLGRRVCVFGGGHLRLAPLPLIERLATQVLGERRPVIFYIHPREIDPSHPRLEMGVRRRFKSYVNLGSTERKLRRLLSLYEFTTFETFMMNFADRRTSSTTLTAVRMGA